MSNDSFIKIDGIVGESQDATHPNEIEVVNWHWAMSQPSRTTSGAAGGAAKANVEDLVFFHPVDRASPTLMTCCLTGKRLIKAVLTLRKAGGVPLDFLRITLSEVIVTAVRMNSAYEEVHLSFARVKQEYLLQNAQGGSQGVVTGTFDLKTNTA